MKEVLISVEGDTEAAFVRYLLSPYLQKHNIYVYSNSLNGIKPYSQIKHRITKLLRSSHLAAVTTMYDLYGLPRSFPGYDTLPTGNGYTKVRHLEQEFEHDINDSRFKAYLQLHEFEALLFTDPDQIAASFPNSKAEPALRKIRTAFASPEDINDDVISAPSKRIVQVIPRYKKVNNGILIAQKIGLPRMRAECRHFDDWVAWLESL